MKNSKNINKSMDFEKTIRSYLKQGMNKLETDLAGTREAIKLISIEKTRDFVRITDRGLNKEERSLLNAIIVSSMYQSFCYGYGIGKIEGSSNNRIVL